MYGEKWADFLHTAKFIASVIVSIFASVDQNDLPNQTV